MKPVISRASFVQRLIAKAINGFVFICIATGFQSIDGGGFPIFGLIGVVLAIAYMLFADGLKGRSIGKRIVRIRVINFQHSSPCTLTESFVRNAGGFGLLRIFTMLEDEIRSDADEFRGTIVVRE